MIVPTGKPLDHLRTFIECPHCKGTGQIDISAVAALSAASSERSGREAVIEIVRKEIANINGMYEPGETRGAVLNSLEGIIGAIRNLAGTKTNE